MLLIFAVQNAGEVEIRFFRTRAEVSLSLVLFISFFIGAIGAVLVSLPAYFRRK